MVPVTERHERLRRYAAALLAMAFVGLSTSPALGATVASTPAELLAPASTLSPAGGAGTTPASPTAGSGQSAPITDDVADPPARTLSGRASWDRLGSGLASIGDLNRDGVDELAVLSRSPWAVQVLVGSHSGFSALPQLTFLSPDPSDRFGAAVAGGGDLDGDGMDDFAVTVGHQGQGGAYTFTVEVYFGSPLLTTDLEHLTIHAPALPSTFGTAVAILEDADGDGLSELLVTAPPPPGSTEAGRAWIFSGAEGSVSALPDWSFTSTAPGAPFGAYAAAAGDLNADGLTDFLVSTAGQPAADGYSRAFVFYGAASLAIEAPQALSSDARQDGFGAAAASGDFNGDGVDDLLVAGPTFSLTAEQPDAGRVYAYAGSASGLSGSPSSTTTGRAGSRFGAALANAGDLNGDGTQDAAIGAPLASAGGPVTNGQAFAYFGGRSGLSLAYDFTEAGEAGNDLFGAFVAGAGDLDGDGRDDLAVAAPGRDLNGLTDGGALYLYSGARIRMPALDADAFSALDLDSGRALSRARPYHLTFTFVFRGPVAQIGTVELAVLSSALGARVAVRYDAASGSLSVLNDARHLVELYSDSGFAQGAGPVHSFHLTASLKFAWAFADPSCLSVDLALQDAGGAVVGATAPCAFSVVSLLAFSAPIEVRRGDGTLLGAGRWARASDTLAWSGGALVYQGTGVVPPSDEIRVKVVDERGEATGAAFDPSTGDLVASKALSAEDDAADLHVVRAVSPSGMVLAESTALVRIDGLPVAFGATSPSADTTVTQADYPVSIQISDQGSGVDGATVEWAVSHTNPPVFAGWQAAAAPSGTQVVAKATIPLLEGTFNFVAFRARDLVGNLAAESTPLPLRLDYGAVTFALLSPSPNAWITAETAGLEFQVRKSGDPLMDLATLEYLAPTTSAGSWAQVGLTGRADDARFTLRLRMPDGVNEVRLRVSLVGKADVYESAPFTVKADRTMPFITPVAPAGGEWETGGTTKSVVQIVDATSGVAPLTVRYRFLMQGSPAWSEWIAPELSPSAFGWTAAGLVPVNDGVENFVVWQAADEAGNGPVTGPYQRLLADSKPVAFERPLPAQGARSESFSRIGIDVTDGDGSGVDLSTVEYKVDSAGGASTGWVSAGRTGIATRATVSVAFYLPEGISTVSWRARDFAGTDVGYSTPSTAEVVVPSARAAPPHLILRAPLPGAHYRAGVDIAFDAEPSRDPDSSVLLFTWSIDGRPRADHGDRIWVQLPPGEHTLTVVVSDGTSTDDITVSFFVDEPVAPPGALSGPAAAAALFSLASIAGAAFATRVWVARARREAGLPAR